MYRKRLENVNKKEDIIHRLRWMARTGCDNDSFDNIVEINGISYNI